MIRIENCLIRKTPTDGKPDGVAQGIWRNDLEHGWAGISVATACDNGPDGVVESVDCVFENTGKKSLRSYDKSPDKVAFRFVSDKLPFSEKPESHTVWMNESLQQREVQWLKHL